jgi:hypothetical protein
MRRSIMEVQLKVTKYYTVEYYDIHEEENPNDIVMDNFKEADEKPTETELEIVEVRYYG